MRRVNNVSIFVLAFLLLTAAAAGRAQAQPRGDFQPRGQYKLRITPHWFGAGDPRFWYRNDLAGGAKEFVLVDAGSGTRQPAFDHSKLAAALSKASGKNYSAERLPFGEIEFADEEKAVRFAVDDVVWKCDLSSYECAKTDGPARAAEEGNDGPGPRPRRRFGGGGERRPDGDFGLRGERGSTSPDGKWSASVKDHNVVLRAKEGGEEFKLSDDGKEGLSYEQLEWSPDSKTLVAWRVEPGEEKEVYLVQSSPPGGGRAVLKRRPYPLPGDKFDAFELNLFDVEAKKQIKPKVDRLDLGRPNVRWTKDGSRLAYQKDDRGHQRLRVIAVDAHTGEARNVIDETTKTFIWTAHTENLGLEPVTWLNKTDEIIYASEKDGCRHLYLVDAKEGKISPITQGEYVIRGIDRIDEDARQIWFNACGKNAGEDPYFLHYYRVNFDGTGLVTLTEGNGTHSVQLSPDRKFLIDTYSRVDAAPQHTLRKTSDGSLVCKLEEADISELKASGWEAPEPFAAKGRDGKTDIWGIISRPKNFDPAKKYPVIEQIYNGPQSAYVPKAFSGQRRSGSLTEAGFVVVQIDGMGTAWRSKAFHDVCWHNLKDAGFPDRIAWHKAAAEKYPWYDATRVGLIGGSAGGQNAAGGLLFHPDFYKAAIANCGCHDNRMDKASWNEQWMGYPVGPQYAESSNIDNAAKLQGRLMLVVGELDDNVPVESTYRFCDALIKADKDFDFLVVTNGGHGSGGAYLQRKSKDFFLRHLQGVDTPNHNAERAVAAGADAR